MASEQPDPEVRDRWLERAHRRAEGAGLRVGAARAMVIEVLAQDGQCLLTVPELTRLVRARGAGSPASVYRIVDELFALGLLHRMDGRDGVARYEIADSEGHHHHVVDEATGRVHAFSDEALEHAIHAVADRLGVTLTGHEVVLRGVRSRAG